MHYVYVFKKIKTKQLKKLVQKLIKKKETKEGITVQIIKYIIEVGRKSMLYTLNRLLAKEVFPNK